MAAQGVLTGIQIHRNGRYPYDYEQVFSSYSDILEHIESDGNKGTKKGTFYAGLYTAVVDDKNSSHNGPYYISYQKTGSGGNIKITYQANRIPLANEITEIEKDWQTSYDKLYSYITNNYVLHNQLKSTGECVDAAYVTKLGKEANLNIILASLLKEAEYKKPSYNFTLKNGVNGEEYKNGSKVEVGSIINLCLNLNFTYYDKNENNRKGMSYGLDHYTFSRGGEKYTYAYDGTYNLGITYTFASEGPNSITDDKPISLYYKKSSHQGYPQLLSKGVYVPSTENWFDDGVFYSNNFIINAQYKYYYGWDADISASSFTPKNGTPVWLPVISSGNTTTTSNIAFNKDHTSFWFAIPSATGFTGDRDHKREIAYHTTTGNFEVLYHTSIGDADLKSTSAVKEEVEKEIIIGNTTHYYKVIKIDFKKKISGATSNYVKFTIKKK